MKYEKGFDKESFLDYLSKTYIGFEHPYVIETAENIINFATKYEHVSKDMFVNFVSDMLPHVSFGEVAYFTEDCCLSEEGIAKKNAFAEEYSKKLQNETTLLMIRFTPEEDSDFCDMYSVVIEGTFDLNLIEDSFTLYFDTYTDYQNYEAVRDVMNYSGYSWHNLGNNEKVSHTTILDI